MSYMTTLSSVSPSWNTTLTWIPLDLFVCLYLQIYTNVFMLCFPETDEVLNYHGLATLVPCFILWSLHRLFSYFYKEKGLMSNIYLYVNK